MQSVVYDFRWLLQTPSDERVNTLNVVDESDEVEQPEELKYDLSALITTNPRDPAFYKQSPKTAKKYAR